MERKRKREMTTGRESVGERERERERVRWGYREREKNWWERGGDGERGSRGEGERVR